MRNLFRALPAAALAGAAAVLSGAAKAAMYGARQLDPRWRRDERPPSSWSPTTSQPSTSQPSAPVTAPEDPDRERDLATLPTDEVEPDAVVVVVDEDGDGLPDTVLAAAVIDEDGDGVPDAVVIAVDEDADGEPDDIIVVAIEEEDDTAAGADLGLEGVSDDELASSDLTGAMEEAPEGSTQPSTPLITSATAAPDADAGLTGGATGGAATQPADAAATVLGVQPDADAVADAPGTVTHQDLAAGSIDPDAETGPVVVTDVTDDDGEEDVYPEEHAETDLSTAVLEDDTATPLPQEAAAEAGGTTTDETTTTSPGTTEGAALIGDDTAGADEAGEGEPSFEVTAVEDIDILAEELPDSPVPDLTPVGEVREDVDDDGDPDHLRRPETHIAEIAERPVATVVREIADLSTDELEQLFAYESTHRKRKTVLQAIERATAPSGDS